MLISRHCENPRDNDPVSRARHHAIGGALSTNLRKKTLSQRLACSTRGCGSISTTPCQARTAPHNNVASRSLW
jgi:hypothetical protein